MSVAKYRKLLGGGLRDEALFILGLDLGNAASAVSYFDLNRKLPETLDISGGYGKPTMPTVMQYLSDTSEWVFGEYAQSVRINEGDVTVAALLEGVGKERYSEAGGRAYSTEELLALYIKELIGNCRHINPKAEIAGICAALPSYAGDAARNGIRKAIDGAGYGAALIDFVDDRECALQRYYFGQDLPPKEQKLLMLDFGAREMRGAIMSIRARSEQRADAEALSYVFKTELGMSRLVDELRLFFIREYCKAANQKPDELSTQTLEQLQLFAIQHQDQLLQRAAASGAVKLYFNHSYPPMEIVVDGKSIESIVQPFKRRLEAFMSELFERMGGDAPGLSDIDAAICCGGGFDMLWARNFVKRVFGEKKAFFFKNSSTAIAEGAGIIAAGRLNAASSCQFNIIDRHRLAFDIGLLTKTTGGSFIPVIERNSFWWQEHEDKKFLLRSDPGEITELELMKRNADGKLIPLGGLKLNGLPKRPSGTTRLSVCLHFIDKDRMVTTVKDMGFGEIYPATTYERQVTFEV